jgi:hypothetical protein
MFKKSTFAALVAGALLVAGAAYAGDAGTAKLEAPAAERTKAIADGAVWQCAGSECVTTLRKAPSVRGCRDLTKEVGVVTAYGTARAQLSAEQLAQCNAQTKEAKAKAATTVAQN